MAAPARVGSPVVTPESVSVTSYTLTTPSGPPAVDGNLLIGIVTNADKFQNLPDFTLTGWTPIDQIGNVGPNHSECLLGLWWKEASSEPGSYEITSTTNSEEGMTCCIEISGADMTTPIHKQLFAESTAGGASALTAAEITDISVEDCYILSIFSIVEGSDAPVVLSGTGWSELVNDNSGPDNWDSIIVVGEKTLSGIADTENAICTPTTNAEGAWCQLAIAPASAYVPTKRGTSGGIQSLNGGMQ